jgi:hypothetical protein
MKWALLVKMKYKSYQVSAEIIEATQMIEKIRITGSWGRSIILQNNRPFFLARRLKHRRWEWDVIEGRVKYSSFVDEVIKQLEVVLRAL